MDRLKWSAICCCFLMTKPQITISILSYYYAYMKDCLVSVFFQTYQNIKVVVHDDCSPHSLYSIVEEFDEPRLLYMRNEKNLQEAKNFNQALDLCDTKLINIFHGDDKMFPWMVETLVNTMEENPEAGMAASTRYYVLSGKGVPVRNCPPSVKVCRVGEYLQLLCKEGLHQIVTSSCIYRKSAIDEVGLRYEVPSFACGDIYFDLKVNEAGRLLLLIETPLLESRFHAICVTNRIASEKWRYGCARLDEYIRSRNPDIDMSKIRAFWAKMTLRSVLLYGLEQIEPGEVSSLRKSLEQENGWFLTDEEFVDIVTVEALAEPLATKLGEGKGKISDYFRKRKLCIEKGLPLNRWLELKRIYKYIVRRRWLGLGR